VNSKCIPASFGNCVFAKSVKPGGISKLAFTHSAGFSLHSPFRFQKDNHRKSKVILTKGKKCPELETGTKIRTTFGQNQADMRILYCKRANEKKDLTFSRQKKVKY
jgi:hypothetical protein